MNIMSVYQPSDDSELLLEAVVNLKNNNVLEIGIGSGIILHCLGSILIITFFESYLSNTYLILGTLGALYFIYIGYSFNALDQDCKYLNLFSASDGIEIGLSLPSRIIPTAPP